MGHSKSSEMSPFDRAHTRDFSTPPLEGGGVNTPYFFLYTPDQSELVTPRGGGSSFGQMPRQHGAFRE